MKKTMLFAVLTAAAFLFSQTAVFGQATPAQSQQQERYAKGQGKGPKDGTGNKGAGPRDGSGHGGRSGGKKQGPQNKTGPGCR